MAEVKWIKITINMFEDEKIDFIESLPEADAILIIWIKLLTLAGKCNANGFIFLTEKIPYTEEMLAHKFRRPLSTVKLALETFLRLEMIQVDDKGYLKVTNWEKHQNVDRLNKIREQTRERVQRYRERQKLLEEAKENNDGNVTCNVTVTDSNAIDIDIEEDIDKENIYIDNVTSISEKKKKKYAEYVSLTEEEYAKLVDKYGESETALMIEKLDNYKGSKGKKYKSDYRAILNWVAKAVLEEKSKKKSEPAQSYFKPFNFDL